jgi:MerR family mercuric resistance operon transcriptional regulator
MVAVNAYTIGQLARAAAVPTSTVRFYERSGLLCPDGRSGGNYRQYSQDALERLRFIRTAQATGFSLEDVRDLLKLTDSDEPPCADIVELTNKRLREIRKRIEELHHVERVLTQSLTNCCRRGTSPDLCDRIISLKGRVAKKCKPGEKCAACP